MINKVVITDNTERAAVIDVILDFFLWHNSIVETSDFGEVLTIDVNVIEGEYLSVGKDIISE